MTKKAILLVVLSAALSANAADSASKRVWVEAPRTENFVDTESIARKGPLLVADILANFGPDKRLPSGQAYRSSIVRTAFDCEGRKSTNVNFELFADLDAKGVSIGKGVNDDAETSWRDARPETIRGALLDFVCSRKPGASG